MQSAADDLAAAPLQHGAVAGQQPVEDAWPVLWPLLLDEAPKGAFRPLAGVHEQAPALLLLRQDVRFAGDHDERAHQLGVGDGQHQGDDRPVAPAEHVSRNVSRLLQEGGHVGGVALVEIEGKVARWGGAAVTAQVGRDHMKALGEEGDLLPPVQAGGA